MKCLKVPGSTSKYLEVPESTSKYLEVPQSTSNYQEVLQSTYKYPKVPRSTPKYLEGPHVPESIYFISETIFGTYVSAHLWTIVVINKKCWRWWPLLRPSTCTTGPSREIEFSPQMASFAPQIICCVRKYVHLNFIGKFQIYWWQQILTLSWFSWKCQLALYFVELSSISVSVCICVCICIRVLYLIFSKMSTSFVFPGVEFNQRRKQFCEGKLFQQKTCQQLTREFQMWTHINSKHKNTKTQKT